MSISPVPPAADSIPYGSDDLGTEELSTAGYAQSEYLIRGTAAGRAFAVRALLRYPVDPNTASGVAIVEPMHYAGGRSVWPVARREIIRSGHAWAEISCQPSAERILKEYDPARYREIQIFDGARTDAPAEADIGGDPDAARTLAEVRRESEAFRRRWFESAVQAPEIIQQFISALRDDAFGIGGADTVILSGLSQTGGLIRNFAEKHHATLSSGTPVVDGFLPMCSGGDAIGDLDVPVIELLAESEMEELRNANLLPGQVRGYSHRREDSDAFRLYEVAGMSHAESRDAPVRNDQPLDIDQRWSLFPSTHVVATVLRSLVNWIRFGTTPPPSRLFELDHDQLLRRDEHGNAVGGLRTAHLDAPTTSVTVISGAGPSWLHGRETPFSAEKLIALYGDEATYREQVRASLAQSVADGYYLEEDAEEYLADASWPGIPRQSAL